MSAPFRHIPATPRRHVFLQLVLGWNREQLAAILLAIRKMTHPDEAAHHPFYSHHDYPQWSAQRFPSFLFFNGLDPQDPRSVDGYEAIHLAQEAETGSIATCRLLLLCAIRWTHAARHLLFSNQGFTGRFSILRPLPSRRALKSFYHFLFPRLEKLSREYRYVHVPEFLSYCVEMAVLGRPFHVSPHFS